MSGWVQVALVYLGLLVVVGVGVALVISGPERPFRRRLGWVLAITGGAVLGIGTVLTLVALMLGGAVDGMNTS